MCVCVCVCARARVCVCVCARARMCVCVCDGVCYAIKVKHFVGARNIRVVYQLSNCQECQYFSDNSNDYIEWFGDYNERMLITNSWQS